jgi:uncharacterized protein (TIGR02266 family)
MEVEVDVQTDTNFYTGLTQDISRGGLFLATHAIKPVGAHVQLTLKLPGEPVLNIDSEVRWTREGSSLQRTDTHGMGLKFLNLSDEQASVINRFLSRRESLFYDDE